MRRGLRLAHAAVAVLFVAAVLVQVFLAGLGIFGDPASLAVHVEFGYTVIGLLALAVVVAAVAARAGPAAVGGALLLLVLYVVQAALPAARSTAPAVAALHPVNALLIFALALVLARRAVAAARQPSGAEGVVDGRRALERPA